MLMDDDFEPRGRNGVDEIEQLVAVQIVGNGDALGAAGSQVVDGPLVGGVEREIADEGNAVLRAKRHAGQVADEEAARAVLGHRAEDADFVGLLNAGRGEIDRRAVLVCCFDGGADIRGCLGSRRTDCCSRIERRRSVDRACGRGLAMSAVRRVGMPILAASDRRVRIRSTSEFGERVATRWNAQAARSSGAAACRAR